MRAVLTGAGMVSALGLSPDEVWGRWRRGETGIRPLERTREPWTPIAYGGEVAAGFKPGDHAFHRKMLKVMSWPVRFGVGAARLAVADAGGEQAVWGDLPDLRRGMFTGAALTVDEDNEFLPALREAEAEGGLDLVRFGREGVPTINPLWLVKGLTNNVLALVAQGYGLRGPNDNIGNGRAGGIQALAEALWALRDGRADALLAGGHDTQLYMEKLVGLHLLGRLHPSPEPPWGECGPLGPGALGTVPGEGAAFVVVEPEERARARGARVRARLLACADACAPAGLGEPLPVDLGREALARAVGRALDEAGLRGDDVGVALVSASGDPAEAAVFGVLPELLHPGVDLLAPAGVLGDGGAAGGAFALALALPVLAEGRHRRALVAAASDTGEIAVALLEAAP